MELSTTTTQLARLQYHNRDEGTHLEPGDDPPLAAEVRHAHQLLREPGKVLRPKVEAARVVVLVQLLVPLRHSTPRVRRV